MLLKITMDFTEFHVRRFDGYSGWSRHECGRDFLGQSGERRKLELESGGSGDVMDVEE